MAALTIRNLPNEDHKALRLRAAEHGVSMEAEARAILRHALQSEPADGAIRRKPPESIAGEARTLGDLISPIVGESDWECLK